MSLTYFLSLLQGFLLPIVILDHREPLTLFLVNLSCVVLIMLIQRLRNTSRSIYYTALLNFGTYIVLVGPFLMFLVCTAAMSSSVGMGSAAQNYYVYGMTLFPFLTIFFNHTFLYKPLKGSFVRFLLTFVGYSIISCGVFYLVIPLNRLNNLIGVFAVIILIAFFTLLSESQTERNTIKFKILTTLVLLTSLLLVSQPIYNRYLVSKSARTSNPDLCKKYVIWPREIIKEDCEDVRLLNEDPEDICRLNKVPGKITCYTELAKTRGIHWCLRQKFRNKPDLTGRSLCIDKLVRGAQINICDPIKGTDSFELCRELWVQNNENKTTPSNLK